jgi:clathrin heavy chain
LFSLITRTSQIEEVECICRESNHYNLEKVKNSSRRQSFGSAPAYHCLDCFDFIHGLVLYLYQNGLTKFIECISMCQLHSNTSIVGDLHDVDYEETTIKGLLASVTGNFPIDDLVQGVKKRNPLKPILPWL